MFNLGVLYMGAKMASNLMYVCSMSLVNVSKIFEFMIWDQYNLVIEVSVLKLLRLNSYLSEYTLLFRRCLECYCVCEMGH